jgi:hypothetical protein
LCMPSALLLVFAAFASGRSGLGRVCAYGWWTKSSYAPSVATGPPVITEKHPIRTATTQNVMLQLGSVNGTAAYQTGTGAEQRHRDQNFTW